MMFQYAYIYAQARKELIPDVYIQSDRFFREYSHEIKRLYGENIQYTDAVSIHVRRGDYLSSNGFYVDLAATDYYKKAIAMFPDEKFLIFCQDRQDMQQDMDDREWCIDYFTPLLGDRFEMHVGMSEVDDLNAMAGCKSNILANSSFSWWAGFLNPNPEKTVVVPSRWFTDGVKRCDFLPEWKQIDV